MVQKYPDEAKNEAKPDRAKDKQSSSNSCPFTQQHRQLYLRKVKNLASRREILVVDRKQVYQISVSDISSKVCKTCGKAIGNEGKKSASTQISDFSSEITICRELATGTREAVRDSSCEAVSLAVCSRRTKDHSKKTSSTENTSGICYCEESVLSQDSLPYWMVQRRQKVSGHSQKHIQTQVSDFTPSDSTLHKFVCKADCCKGGVCPNSGCICPYKVPHAEPAGDFSSVDATCACSQNTGSTLENKVVPQIYQMPRSKSPTVSSVVCSCQECVCSTKDVSVDVSMESSEAKSCACANCVCSSTASVCQSKASETEAFIVEKRVDNLAKGELGTLGIGSECSNIECIYSNTRFAYLKRRTEDIKSHYSNEDQDTPSDYPDISDDTTEDAVVSDSREVQRTISKTLIGPVRNAIYQTMQTLESLDVFKAVLVKDTSDPMKAKPKAPSNEAIAPGYRTMWVDTVKEQSLIPLSARSNLMIFPSSVTKAKEQQKSGKILTDTESVRQACTAALCKAVWLAIQSTDKPINLITPTDHPTICADAVCPKIQPKSDIKISGKPMEDVRKDRDKQTTKSTKAQQKSIVSDWSRERMKTKLVADTGKTGSKAKLGIDSKTSRMKLETKTRQSKEGLKRTDICRPTASTVNRIRTVSPNINKEHAKKEKIQLPTSKIHPKGSGVVYKDPTKAKDKDQKARGRVKEDMSPRDGKVCLSKPKICPAIHQNKDEFPGIIRAEVENATFGDIGNSFILCSVCSTMSQATSALCVAITQQKAASISPTRSFCDKNEGTVELQVTSPPETRIVSEQGSPTSSKGFVCSFPTKNCPIGSVSHNASPVTLFSDTDGVQDNESGFKMPEDLAVLCSGCGFWHKLYKFPTIQEMKAFTPLQLASLCQCDSCNCKVCWNKPKSPADKCLVVENVGPESPRSPKKTSGMDDHDCCCIASKEKHNNSTKCDCTKCSLVAMKKEIESLRKKLTVLINGNRDTKPHKPTPSLTKVNQEATNAFKRTRDVIKKPVIDIEKEKKKPLEVISKKLLVHPKAGSRQSKEQNRTPSERSSRTSSLFVTNNYSLRDTRKGVASSTAAVTLKNPERSDPKPKKKATTPKTGKAVPKEWYRNAWK